MLDRKHFNVKQCMNEACCIDRSGTIVLEYKRTSVLEGEKEEFGETVC